MQSSRRRAVVVALLTVLLTYAAAPYVTLYRLASSIRRGDDVALEALVDWDGVREGIKEDICDTVFDAEPAQAAPSRQPDALPPFGFSFVRGIASNAIDENVTPTGLVTAASRFQAVSASGVPLTPPAADGHADPSIVWAFFTGPTTFRIDLLPPPEAGFGKEPVRIDMELGGSGWKVTRAWLPPSMLRGPLPRT
ncbi:MAG: DUF2939 domain-containing protein [Acetobacteraceae bacterium]|nr:DUF2939 domain-containing protein [Acetobacteraceae bacterium]